MQGDSWVCACGSVLVDLCLWRHSHPGQSVFGVTWGSMARWNLFLLPWSCCGFSQQRLGWHQWEVPTSQLWVYELQHSSWVFQCFQRRQVSICTETKCSGMLTYFMGWNYFLIKLCKLKMLFVCLNNCCSHRTAVFPNLVIKISIL